MWSKGERQGWDKTGATAHINQTACAWTIAYKIGGGKYE